MTVDIIDYLGKHEDGILVLISLGYEDDYYESTFYYRDRFLVLTVDENLENRLGCAIEDWHGYQKLMFEILSRVVPYEEIIKRSDDFNPESYGIYLETGTQSN